MDKADGTQDDYLIAHLQEAFATDPRTSELGIDISVSGHTVVLTGTVATSNRRAAAGAVASEALQEHTVRNEVAVADLSEPPAMEHLS